jgi:branched-chain amino acid transport system substrate-binding protein
LRTLAASKPQVVLLINNSLDYAQQFQAYRKLDAGAYIVGLSAVNPRTVLELVSATAIGGAVLSQVMINPQNLSAPLVREFDRAFRRFFDEQPSHQSLEGYVVARYVLDAAKRVNGAVTRTSLLQALQATSRLDVLGFELNFANAEQRGSQFVDLVMIRSDGRLVQ